MTRSPARRTDVVVGATCALALACAATANARALGSDARAPKLEIARPR